MTPVPAGDVDKGDVVLLVARGPLGDLAVQVLAHRFPGLVVLREEPETKWQVIRRRMRLLGVVPALGQVAAGLMFRALGALSKRRMAELTAAALAASGADKVTRCAPRVIDVGSVNSRRCRRALQLIRPKVVAVYGTRLISKQTLGVSDVPFLNFHPGINPKYRGQHPAYWARAEGDPANAGVTVHLVDHGVDTGEVVYQARVPLEKRDTIATYPYAMMATGLRLLGDAVEDACAGRLVTRQVMTSSRLWFPPTAAQYVWNGVVKGVW